jgi:plastocyanin
MHSKVRGPATFFLAVAGAFVLLVGAAQPLPAADHRVLVSNFMYNPPQLTIQAGDTVTWVNTGGLHNAVADDRGFRCASGCDDTGGQGDASVEQWSATRRFDQPGSFPYFCELHGFPGGVGMAGRVTVTAAEQICTPGDDVLCLADGRFRVEVAWETPDGATGPGRPRSLTRDSGAFWFFQEANLEMLVKVIDGCAVNGRHWVFAGGLTNVGLTLTVTDLRTGTAQRYVNGQGTAFQPVQDTAAFSTCP